ncbi:MAG: GxxExxY protein [Methylovulum sp.]|nr:MAG: GxxExxY protein [Methylovulum sp.]
MNNIPIYPNKQTLRIDPNVNLLFPELSYRLMGILFKVHNELGSHYQEKYYQRAIERALEEERITFEKEKMIPLEFHGKSIGKYFLDFVIERKIALEIKTIDFFKKREWNQVRNYLKAAELELGILVNFNSDKLIYKRILCRL